MQNYKTSKVNARALLFGLNYPNTSSALNGCINDVKNVSKYLKSKFNIPIDMYTDDILPLETSYTGIIQNLYELGFKTYTENLDFVWIHYSGHGSYVDDKNKDEKDGYDECLVPTDYDTRGLITDDVISRIFQMYNPKTKIIAIFDCCHSGTIADMKYNWVDDKTCTVENILCNLPNKIITLSGCMDNQTSADAYNVMGDFQYVGALSACLLMTLKEDSTNDVFEIFKKLQKSIKDKKFTQIPRLCSTYNLARDRQFV
jgi:hypothetical protein